MHSIWFHMHFSASVYSPREIFMLALEGILTLCLTSIA